MLYPRINDYKDRLQDLLCRPVSILVPFSLRRMAFMEYKL
jgi:hypothetical protein